MKELLREYRRFILMEHSRAYKYLYEQLNATGSKKGDGYYSKIMEEIYDWEREEVEDVIWESFRRDKYLAEFLPKLKKYDGVKELKEALVKCNVPSDNSVTIAQVLYEYTGDDKYLDVIKQNINKDEDALSYVSVLADCKPCKKAYNWLVEIYLKSNDKTIRSTAVEGILYNKGVITNPQDTQEYMKNIELVRKFATNDKDERKKIIERFENGQL